MAIQFVKELKMSSSAIPAHPTTSILMQMQDVISWVNGEKEKEKQNEKEQLKSFFLGCDETGRTTLLYNESEKIESPESHYRTLTPTELDARVKDGLQKDALKPEEFWERFLSSDFEAWDHYTHLKAAYFVLLDNLEAGRNVIESADDFLVHMERLQQADPETFQNTTNRTMTIFWLVKLQQASLKAHWNKITSAFPTRADWPLVLAHSPEMMDPGLPFAYYSKSKLVSAEARASWILPEKKELPFYPPPGMRQPEIRETQADYVPEHLIDFALDVTKQVLYSKIRRGAILKQALPELERSIIRMRNDGEPVAPFSQTQAYFWLQFVHATVAAFRLDEKQGSKVAEWMSLSVYVKVFAVTGLEWKRHYTSNKWHSIQARMRFQPPDIKPLPNVLEVRMPMTPSQRCHMLAEGDSFKSTLAPQIPETEDLEIMVAAALDEASWSDILAETEVATSHGEYLNNLYEILGNDTSENMAERMEEALLIESKTAVGVTARNFWVQQISAKVVNCKTSSFEEFLNENPQLAFRTLPLVYYSEVVWESSEARDTLVAPDRMSLPSIASDK